MTEVEEFVPSSEVAFPYPKPIPAPHQREYKQTSGDLHLLLRRPAVEECFCIEHGPTAELAYMRHIYKKNELLYDKLQQTRKIMAQRANSIIDHHCPDIDAKMDVLYALDYFKRAPRTFSTFYPPYERGLTEYEGAYSITGMALMRNASYPQPQPSSRARANDFHT